MRDTLFLLVILLAVFGASITASFHFDDYSIFTDPAITSTMGWLEVWRLEQTRPLTYFTFWMNYQAGGRNPAGYHAVNFALHAGAVLLLFSALKRLLPQRPALIAACLFAIHPLQAEPVVYIFARASVLATLLCLVSLGYWLRGRHWLSVAWFAGALLAKEECVAFPAFLLLLFLSISHNRAELRPIAAMFALALLAGARVLWATLSVEGAGFRAGIPPIDYFLTQGKVILRYFQLLLFPFGYTVDPLIKGSPALEGLLCWIAILVVVYLATRRFSRAREGFWFIGGLVLLLPSSSIFPAIDLAADRRMYLPLIAFSAALGLMARNLPRAALLFVAAALVILSFARTQVWLTERTLWAEAVRRAPEKIRPRIQLARAVGPPEAFAVLEEASRISPDDPALLAELGALYLAQNDAARALAAFGRVLALSPIDPRAQSNRGAALLALGQLEAARADFEKALAMDPCLFDARVNLRRTGRHPPDPPHRCRFTPEQQRSLAVQ